MATILPFDEINAMMRRKGSEEDADALIEELLGLLILAYQTGVECIRESLDVPVEDEIDEMYEIIFCRIGGMTFEDRLRQHLEDGDYGRVGTLAESETHRVSEAASYRAALRAQRDFGAKVGKKWNTMLDDRVREKHVYLEGRVVGLDEEFYTYDGDHAQYPGGFENPDNNCGCRCTVTYTALDTTGVTSVIGQGSP